MAEVSKKTAEGAGKELPAPVAAKRTGFFQFFRESYREGWEKVTKPSWKETYLTTIMVFILVGLMMVFFFVIDLVLSSGESWIMRFAA